MKRILFIVFSLFIVGAYASPAAAQCPSSMTPIRCGYYNEAYGLGAQDARQNLSNDYRRHRNRYQGQYETDFRNGYQAGYVSVRPAIARWTASQRSAYNSGHSIGQSDRRQGGQGRSQAARGRYDSNIALYFQQGYNDGFNNIPRRYDFAVDQNPPTWPPVGGGWTSGRAVWEGSVDDRGNVILRGNTITTQNVSGNGIFTRSQNVSASLPRRATNVQVRRLNGRGTVTILQQPNRMNDFSAVIQIYDSRGGSDNYRIEITWSGPSNVEEPYSSGRVQWRGRVDQTVHIIITGDYVQAEVVAGSGLSGAYHNLTGYLARRPGSVTARKRDGRGDVSVVQQPSRQNDYTAIIRIHDESGGADNYEVEISW